MSVVQSNKRYWATPSDSRSESTRRWIQVRDDSQTGWRNVHDRSSRSGRSCLRHTTTFQTALAHSVYPGAHSPRRDQPGGRVAIVKKNDRPLPAQSSRFVKSRCAYSNRCMPSTKARSNGCPPIPGEDRAARGSRRKSSSSNEARTIWLRSAQSRRRCAAAPCSELG
jgi:hypothetical protein